MTVLTRDQVHGLIADAREHPVDDLLRRVRERIPEWESDALALIQVALLDAMRMHAIARSDAPDLAGAYRRVAPDPRPILLELQSMEDCPRRLRPYLDHLIGGDGPRRLIEDSRAVMRDLAR